MSPTTKATSFRFDPDLLARLDAYAENLSRSAGVPVSRAAAATKLLTDALERAETTKSRKK